MCRIWCRRAWVLHGLLLAALVAVDATPAYAISFNFSPGNIKIQARPGQLLNRSLSITLAKDTTPTRFRAHVEDWWRSADNKRTFYMPAGTVARSCGPWCAINPVEAVANPGETLTVKLSIRVPDDVQPGGYWAALTLTEVPDPMASRPTGVGMVFKTSLSVGIFVEVPPANRSATITGARVTGDKAFVTLHNDGNIPLRVTGTFEFYKPGEEQPTAKAQMPAEPLLPEPINTVEFSVPLPSAKELPSGRYKVRAIIDTDLDYLMGVQKELDIVRSENT